MAENYYLKRTAQAIFTVWAVVTITFLLIRFLPGGPIDFVRAQLLQNMQEVNSDRINRLVSIYTNINPDKPLYVQYADYMWALLHGDLGQSMWYQEPVSKRIADGAPWTVLIGVSSIIITFSTTIVLGAILAYREESNLDIGGSLGLTILHGVPYYIIGLALQLVVAYELGWLPATGRKTGGTTAGFNWPFFAGVIEHAALPLISLTIANFGAGALAMRGNSIKELGKDYVRVARLRGLSSNAIALGYVARNAVLPMYTWLLLSIGFMFGGSVILETIFAYTGLGWYMFRAIEARDYPLMMGVFLLITVAVVIAIYIGDLTYSLIDPRIEQGEKEAF